MSIEFEYLSNVVYFIIPILVIIILFLSYRKRDRIISQLHYKAEYKYKVLKSFLIGLGLVLIVTSLLGPQIFKGYQEVKKEGLDIYVLIDTSKSMWVQDVRPNRLRRAKKAIARLINVLKGDRIGFIPFASDAYIQMPLTNDYNLAQMFLNVIDTEMMAGGGTDLTSALNLASKSFQRSAPGDRVILIFSDGEAHNNNGVKVAREFRGKVFTVGVGTKKGGLIPVFNEKGKKTGYKKNNSGEHIVSKYKPEFLKQIADLGEGEYYSLSTVRKEKMDQLLKAISHLQRGQIKSSRIKTYTKLFQYFLGAGILLFLVGYLMPERRD